MKQNTLKQTRSILLAIVMLVALVLSTFVASSLAGAQRPEEVTARVNTHRQNGNQDVKEERAALRQQQQQEKRQEICEKRLGLIETKISGFADRATRLQGVIDKIYLRVQGFYDSGQLTVSNYDELNAAVESAQLNASTEIAALTELSTDDIDCTDPNVSVKVASFKDGLGDARDALKAYRKALVELISSLRAAAAEENANNTNGSTDENEDSSDSTGTTDDTSDTNNTGDNTTEN